MRARQISVGTQLPATANVLRHLLAALVMAWHGTTRIADADAHNLLKTIVKRITKILISRPASVSHLTFKLWFEQLKNLRLVFTSDEVRVGVVRALIIVKVKTLSRKRNHKLDGIGVRRIGTFPFSQGQVREGYLKSLKVSIWASSPEKYFSFFYLQFTQLTCLPLSSQ